MRRIRSIPALLLCACAVAWGTARAIGPDELSPPELTIDHRGGVARVWVEAVGPDGTLGRRPLRVTTARVEPGAGGRDPAGRAAFVTWTEDRLETWSSWSRDGGVTWSEARRLSTELRLRDGATTPGAPIPQAPEGYALPPSGRLFLVQLHTISLPEWREALTSVGVELLGFFPHQAHMVRTPAGTSVPLDGLEFVNRVEPYHPWYRIERELREWLDHAGSVGGEQQLRVNVMAFEWGPAGKDRIARFAETLGARVAENWPNGHIVELWIDRQQLRRLAAHDDVMWIDRWSPPEFDMNNARQDSGADWLDSVDGYCGQGVRGETLDTGCEETHQDFDGILLHGQNTSGTHGTRVYGTVFGNGNRDADGEAQATGHLPCAQGICADTGFLGDRFAHTQELKQSPYFASFQTNSWGSSRTTNYTSNSHEMDDIIWRLDIAITQSQSNSGNQNSRPQAWAKNIIAVGGMHHENTLTTSDDKWNGAGTDASIGPAEDGRIKPDLNYWYDDIYTTYTDNGYTCCFGGTSAATPTAAGVIGLMVQMWSENVWGTDPQGATVFERQPHFSTIKALAINNAQQYPFVGQTHDLTRVHQGWGRPSARMAKERAARSFIVDEEVPLEVGQGVTYFLEVLAGESELKVTMVYPDLPGTTSASLHRINDVDLTVLSPSADTYHGNVGLLDGNYSVAGGASNGLDTVENVFVENPEPGIWSVTVDAVEVNQDAHTATPEADVTYALVVTGAAPSSPPPTPGESASLRITGYDHVSQVVSLTYGASCAATDSVIEFGELTPANIASYNWSGQECGLGTGGSYDWDVSAEPASLFFVIVGNNGSVEGSYGIDSSGTERPEDLFSLDCPLPQDLTGRCD